jgi:acyl-CoA synthetase (AMP-forming)/AMP-acid ligase II
VRGIWFAKLVTGTRLIVETPLAFEWIRRHAERRPDAPAVGSPSGWVTYGELAGRIESLAAHLASKGVNAGDHVVLALPNLPATVIASYAAQSLGACAVEVNREWGAAAIGAIVSQVRARHAVVFGRDAALWGELAAAHGLAHVWVVHPSKPPEKMQVALKSAAATWVGEDGVGEVPRASLRPGEVDASSAALLVYTSGSTGTPRGVIQTHRNIDANTRSIVEYLRLGETDRAMAILPLFYCYGKSVLQSHLFAGASVFLDNRFMYPRVVLEALGTEGCTGFAGVPLTFELIKRQLEPKSIPMPKLRYLTQAGGPMHPDTIRWVRQAFAPAELFVMYGQTEATARLSYLPPSHAESKFGSIGRGIPGVELKILNEQGEEQPVNEVGQLVARGGNITPGYFQAPEDSAAILKNGWLWTGDLGYRDADGFIFITGRAKEIMKIGGHRVSAVEIEQGLCTHPEVLEAAVVGVSDEVGGEAAVAFVVRKEGSSLSDAELKKFCRERLPPYKVPKTVTFVEALPRTSAGKVAKSELKARATNV